MLYQAKPPPRALPPGPPNDAYDKAIAAALEGLSLGINARLQDRDDHWRFQDVVRLGKIGQALARQLARRKQSVDGYVRPGVLDERPAARNGPNFACGPEDMDNLGGIDDDDPFREDMGIGPYGGPHGMGIGHGRMNNPAIPVDPGNPFAAVGQMFVGLEEQKAKEVKSGRRVDSMRELKEVRKMLSDDAISEEEKDVLEDRRSQLLDEIRKDNEESVEPDPDAHVPPPADLIVRCLDPRCNTAHDADWAADDGTPRACDVCNGPMAWAPARMPQPPAAAPIPQPPVNAAGDAARPPVRPDAAPEGLGHPPVR